MESTFAAAMLTQPTALFLLTLVVCCSVYVGARYAPARLSWQRIAGGLAGVFIASLVIAAISSYTTPEEARRFGVGPEHYASALWHEFVILEVILAYASLFGCAVIGVPVALILAKRGFATTPLVLAASIPISFAFLAVMSLALGSSPYVASDAGFVVGSHAFAALGFVLGARLPWSLRSYHGAEA